MKAIIRLLAIFLVLMLPLCVLAAEQEPKPSDEAVETPSLEPEDKPKEDAGLAPVDEAWENLWSGQQEMVKEIRETALRLSSTFSTQAEELSHKLQPFDEEGRRLLVFINTFKGYPQPLEAIMGRIASTIAELDEALEPVTRARAEAESLLQRVNHMATSLPDTSDRSRFSDEMKEYSDSILRARIRLSAVLAQYDSLLPSLTLVNTLETARKNLAAQLPTLWKNYYLQRPVPWLNPDTWSVMPRNLRYSWQVILMRLPVEMPTSIAQWGVSILRFCIGLLFGGAIVLLLRRRWLTSSSPTPMKRIFGVCAFWLVLGSALLGSAMATGGDFFRVFLSVGSCCIIFGEVLIAWELRLLQFPETTASRPPFLRLLPLALFAYILLYLPLPQAFCLVLWVLILIIAMADHKYWRKFSQPKMQLENTARECASLLLWPCLFLAVSGFQIYSMALYIAYVSLAVACELSLGGMAVVSRVNEHLPQEGASAVLARLAVALAAPFVLVLAVAGACLWVVVLPGGAYLLSEYALKGVSIGATQFNIVQILLIISAFYLTRTVVAMGTRFIAKLPQQGSHFDATLITPMQTAFTYLTWAVFALFALHSMGVSLSNLAMVAGGLSVGIGFGMQTIVNNFLSGLILIFGRTLQVGDVVEVGGTTGRVRKISVRATMVETYDNAIIYVPNSEFMASRLTNWTSFTRSVRRQIQVGVAYGSDTSLTIKLLIDIAKAHPNVLQYPAPSVNFADFAASSLDFRLRFWVKDYELGASTSSDLRLSINQVFAEHNIEIAFPQLDVHLKDMPDKQAKPAPSMPPSVPVAAGEEKGQTS